MRSLIFPASTFLLLNSRLYGTKLKNKPRLFGVISTKFCSTNLTQSRKMVEENVFHGTVDKYEGVIIDSENESCSAPEFSKKLENSLKFWIDSKKRGIWFKVHLNNADWVPILAQNGFKYHHAKENFVTMYRWLPNTQRSSIPPYASTLIGAGAVVVNEKNEILVVREKQWKYPHWKLPGGFADPGENIVDAAIREVYEETNILTQFKSLLSLRHTHKGMWDCSDLYIVVSLKPLSSQIKKCDREIQEAKWMPIEEYVKHPDVHKLNRFCAENYLDMVRNKLKVECTHGIHPRMNKPYTIYYVKNEDDEHSTNI